MRRAVALIVVAYWASISLGQEPKGPDSNIEKIVLNRLYLTNSAAHQLDWAKRSPTIVFRPQGTFTVKPEPDFIKGLIVEQLSKKGFEVVTEAQDYIPCRRFSRNKAGELEDTRSAFLRRLAAGHPTKDPDALNGKAGLMIVALDYEKRLEADDLRRPVNVRVVYSISVAILELGRHGTQWKVSWSAVQNSGLDIPLIPGTLTPLHGSDVEVESAYCLYGLLKNLFVSLPDHPTEGN